MITNPYALPNECSRSSRPNNSVGVCLLLRFIPNMTYTRLMLNRVKPWMRECETSQRSSPQTHTPIPFSRTHQGQVPSMVDQIQISQEAGGEEH